jgi:hypothetical protein
MVHIISNLFRRWGALFLVSFLGLFMELAVIRWLSGEIRIFAYFQNLALLSAFMGFSIGFALVGKGRDYRFSFPALWGLFALLVIAAGTATAAKPLFYPGSTGEFLWDTATVSAWYSLPVFIGLVIVFFLTSMFLFIPLGQATGEEMALHPPVIAYIVNLLASLAGIWAFSLLSFLRMPPVVWFGCALVGAGIYFAYQHKLKPAVLVIFGVTLAAVWIFNQDKIWSPYNRLNLTKITKSNATSGETLQVGYLLNVQQAFYQAAFNLTPEFIQSMRGHFSDETVQEMEGIAYQYSLPYQFLPDQGQVLVVGAGMGNDVAAALRSEVGKVVAVEIDPVILSLGKEFHPEQPYADPRVVPVIDDARSFFTKDQEKYDLIAFGFLDSHTLLSGMSSVRLDSFVYTIDSFEQVKSRLKPGGIVTIAFGILKENRFIEERLGRMLSQVYGAEKVFVYRGAIGTTFVIGDLDPKARQAPQLSTWSPDPAYDDLPLPTDNWPYIYLRDRKIPSGYWWGLLPIALVSLFIIARSFPEALSPDIHFWLLGAAFMLVEFKSITELALLFGTTWFVNSLAISGILIMALFANLLVLRVKRVNLGWAYGLLFACLALSFTFPLEWLSGFPNLAKALLSTLLLSLPLFFAGLIFSESLRRAGETARPLASNFSGSAVGGLLEYGSSYWGIKSLYILAALLYGGAMLAAFRRVVGRIKTK